MGNKEEKAWSSNSRKEEKEKEKEEDAMQPAPLKLQKENVVQKIAVGETEETAELKGKKESGGKTLTTPGKEKLTENKQDGDATTAQQQSGVSPKLFSPFFEVRS